MEKLKGFLLIGVSYIVAFLAAYFVFEAIAGGASVDDWLSISLGLLAADAVATIIVWLFGVIFKNSSFYDPYWSLTPFVIILFLMIRFGLFGATNIIFVLALGFWSWRLTFNWAYTFKNLKTQDWRYDMYKSENSVLVWHIINFFGINFMPTLFVYLGLLPAIFVVLTNAAFNPFVLIGAGIIVFGASIEFFADIAIHNFRKSEQNAKRVLDTGLWSISRHPNYFGEITVWLGVYLFMLPVLLDMWFMFGGFLAMVGLFVFISIPMAEKRQLLRRSEYAEYQKRVSMLLPLPKRK